MMSAKSPAIAALLSAGVAVAGCASDPRAGFERVQVGDSWAGVERLMGRPETTIWEYQAIDQLFVEFKEGQVTGLLMRLPEDDPRSTKGDFRPPVEVGMTQGQVEAILGSPTEICNRHVYSAELRGQVCFSKGRAVVSKQIINVIPPPPLLH